MAKAVMRCVSSTNTRPKKVAQPKGKTMANQNDVPAAPDYVAYSRALKQGKSRDEAMAIAHRRGAEVAAAKEAAARSAAEYRR